MSDSDARRDDVPTGPANPRSPAGPDAPTPPGGPQRSDAPAGDAPTSTQTDVVNQEMQLENAESALDQPSDGSGGE